MDDRLREWMIRAQIIRSDGVSKRVSYGRCVECKATVMRALDGDVAAVAVTLDVGEVDNLGEVVALLQGRRTYNLIPFASQAAYSRCIVERKAYHIQRPRSSPVIIEHSCDKPLVQKTSSKTFRGFDRECPFYEEERWKALSPQWVKQLQSW